MKVVPPPPSAGGSGDVVGPVSATDGQLALFSGATGKVIREPTTADGVRLKGGKLQLYIAATGLWYSLLAAQTQGQITLDISQTGEA